MARQDPTGTQVGDKVRLRLGPNAGERGLVEEVNDSSLLVHLNTGERVIAPHEGITNYSLAARRAWDVMPKRAGRPSSASPPKKMVSIRIDSQVWGILGQAVDLGLIASREQAINIWLHQKADELFAQVAARKSQAEEQQDV
jgi:hypothetical protein